MTKLNPPPLDLIDIRILAALSEDGGFSTKDVARRAGLAYGRKHAGVLHNRIRYLEDHHLVVRLDDEKPIAWLRMPAGTAAQEPFLRKSPTPPNHPASDEGVSHG